MSTEKRAESSCGNLRTKPCALLHRGNLRPETYTSRDRPGYEYVTEIMLWRVQQSFSEYSFWGLQNAWLAHWFLVCRRFSHPFLS